MSLVTILPQITAAVKIPVLAAGGIIEAQGVRGAVAMGAEGVYVGTRFINTFECPAADECKQAIIDGHAQDLLTFRGRVGRMRTLPTKTAKRAYDVAQTNVSDSEVDKAYANGYQKAMRLGHLDDGIICVSEAIDEITSNVSAVDVVKKLAKGFETPANVK